MRKTRFHVAAMDCPSEEQQIRTALRPNNDVEHVEVDIAGRTVVVWHHGDVALVQARLEDLGLGASLLESREDAGDVPNAEEPLDPSRALRMVLALNAAMFAVELIAGVLAESTGLLADSLDMLADAGVYGVALWAATSVSRQRAAARLSGWLQLALALGVLAEVGRRAAFGSSPEAPTMLGIAALALIVNVVCMVVLARHRHSGAHMKASWIFTSNDVIANAGVIAAGILVASTQSRIPDLIIGAIIGLVVLRGAVHILRLSRR